MDTTKKPATKKEPVKKITMRDRKKAQPEAKLFLSDQEKKVIANTVASKLSEPQRNIFFYTCQALGLNPLLNQICAVPYKDKFGNSTMSIQVMRDGFLSIAHSSGKFAGLESGVEKDGEELVGWAKVYHRDFKHPVYQRAYFSEYAILERGGKPTLWKTKPRTMIQKVAESMALRKAFNVSGVYASEEMELEISKSNRPQESLAIEGGEKPANERQIVTLRSLGVEKTDEEFEGMTKQEAVDYIKDLSQKKAKK